MNELMKARTMLAKPDALLLDIRTPQEYQAGHFSGARLIPTPLPPLLPHDLEKLRRDLRMVVSGKPTTTPIVVYCKLGKRTRIAAGILRDEGFINVLNLQGIQTDPLRSLIARGESL